MSRARPPRPITPALLRRWPLPALDGRLGKVARGQVLVVGGSDEIVGAAILSGIAALRAGAGTLVMATSAAVAPHVAVALPEARVVGLRTRASGELAPTATRVLDAEVAASEALVIGPGMRDGAAARELLVHCRRSGATGALVVDAAAVSVLGRLSARERPTTAVITPHVGEMAKLLELDTHDVLADPETHARAAARELDAIVVLKGHVTYVAAPDGACFANAAGNLGLGTAGSGDTLAGLIAGLAARGADRVQAAVWGVHVHARAGEALARQIAPLGYLARELLDELPRWIATYSRRR